MKRPCPFCGDPNPEWKIDSAKDGEHLHITFSIDRHGVRWDFVVCKCTRKGDSYAAGWVNAAGEVRNRWNRARNEKGEIIWLDVVLEPAPIPV